MHIDSIAFEPDSAGFGFARPSAFIFPINIEPDSVFQLPIEYVFPTDSLNGPQQVTIILYERRGSGEEPAITQTTAIAYRKQRTLTLHALLPKFESSAGDIAPLRLPITVEGPRDQVQELNSWTLKLQFSNDLFEPVGVDTAGSLTVPVNGNYSLSTSWDRPTRTYTISVTNAAVADPAKLANNLLLAVLMRAYLTTDTIVTVTPTFTFLTRPCAYNLQPFTLTIPFADDCGLPTLRAFMRGQLPIVNFISIRPNPIKSNALGVIISYDASEAAQIIATTDDLSGQEIGQTTLHVTSGTGEIAIPPQLLPPSGAAFITLDVRNDRGISQPQKTLKVSISQ